jgi:hypothetical protein
MSKGACLVATVALCVACSSEGPQPTAPISVPVFSDADRSPNANGGNYGTPLSGDEEVPARPTRARGSAVFQLSEDGTELSYKLIVANIENVFQAHIHRGAFGANGPIVVWLFPDTDPEVGPRGQGRLDGVIAKGTITAANFQNVLAGQPMSTLIADLKNGNAYVNVHTDDGIDPTNTGPGDFPGGEVRGQIEHRGHR